jgi:hypothetical protein
VEVQVPLLGAEQAVEGPAGDTPLQGWPRLPVLVAVRATQVADGGQDEGEGADGGSAQRLGASCTPLRVSG